MHVVLLVAGCAILCGWGWWSFNAARQLSKLVGRKSRGQALRVRLLCAFGSAVGVYLDAHFLMGVPASGWGLALLTVCCSLWAVGMVAFSLAIRPIELF